MTPVQVFEGDGKMTPEWEVVRDENEVLKKKTFQAEWDADQLKRRVEKLIKERDDKRRETIKSLDELNSIIMNQKATIKDLLEQRDAAENKINDVHLALSGALLPEKIRPCKHPHDDDHRPHYDPDEADEPDEDDKA